MQEQDSSKQLPSQAAALPANPIQSPVLTWQPGPSAAEFTSAWHPQTDVTDLEETLDQAVAHLKKLLRLTGNRSNINVIKARQFLAQFD